MSDCIDIHTHVVPERFPAYAGKGRDVPWPAMAEAHACHKHVMISGKVYRTVADSSWSVPRRVDSANMGEGDPLGTLEKSGLGPVVIAAVASGNARRFLGL